MNGLPDPDHRHPLLLREPDGDDVHERRIKAGFRRAEQEPDEIERELVLHEHHAAAERSPGHGETDDAGTVTATSIAVSDPVDGRVRWRHALTLRIQT